jgi:hypothetical protein
MQGASRRRKFFGLLIAGTAIGILLSVGAFNYLLDPYAIFGVKNVTGLNAIKPRPDVMRQDLKAMVGVRFRPNALILGNSRAEIGFDPRHPAFEDRHLRAFNAAIPGTGIDYSLQALRTFSEASDVRVAVVGLDFLDFLVSPTEAESTSASAHGLSLSPTKTRLLAAFSSTAFLDSLQTLRIQRHRDPATLRADGFNPLLDYREIAAKDGYSVLFRQRAQETARSLERQPHNLYVGAPDASPAYTDLRDLLRVARDRNIELHLVIYPYHVLLLLQYQEAGLEPLLNRWKADVARLVEDAQHAGGTVSLWDFACPHELVAERIPGDGDVTTKMQWFWEAGHFKKELGDVVLARIFDENPPFASRDFGAPLTPSTIEGRANQCVEAMAVTREGFPQLAADAAKWARRARGRI